jgi:uncharacterized protein
MRFTQEGTTAVHLIRAYAPGEVRINEVSYRDTVMVSAAAVTSVPEVHGVDDLGAFDPLRLMAQDPEIVLLGTGQRQIFPPAAFRSKFLSAGVGFEVMDTGAACRTFNVLLTEQRRVVALLML